MLRREGVEILRFDHVDAMRLRELHDALRAAGCSSHLIGGADVAAELDAKRAILQGTTLAAGI